MPKFAYAAIDTAGAPVEGVTKAETIGAARAILVEQNLFPTKIEEVIAFRFVEESAPAPSEDDAIEIELDADDLDEIEYACDPFL